MPTYSYACTDCSNRFDAVQAFSDDATTELPRVQWSVAQALRQRGCRLQGQWLLPQRQPRIVEEFVEEFIDVDQRGVRRLGIVDLIVVVEKSEKSASSSSGSSGDAGSSSSSSAPAAAASS